MEPLWLALSAYIMALLVLSPKSDFLNFFLLNKSVIFLESDGPFYVFYFINPDVSIISWGDDLSGPRCDVCFL